MKLLQLQFFLILGNIAIVRPLVHSPNSSVVLMRDVEGIANRIYRHIIEDLNELLDPSITDVAECFIGMSVYIKHLVKGNMWALKMLDSSSKIQSGILDGNFQNMGQYDECVKIKAESSTYSLAGMHCLVTFKLSFQKNQTTTGKPEQTGLLFGTDIPLTTGQCFPSVCKPWVIQESYNKLASYAKHLSKSFTLKVEMKPTDCHILERGEYTVTEWVVLIFVLFFAFIASMCTIVDIFHLRKLEQNQLKSNATQQVLSFSMYNNWNKLMSTKTTADSMPVINGLKFWSISWVVFGHRYSNLLMAPVDNILTVIQGIDNWDKVLLLSAPLSVDTFFMMAGLLNMYSFCALRKIKKSYSILDILISYLHRFLRLTPAYAMMMALTATWLYRTGNGAYWDRIITTEQKNCEEKWWQGLLYVNNYIDDGKGFCISQSWYLAADMQMFWVSPFIMYPLWRWPWFGYIEIFILGVASIASPFLVSYYEEFKTPFFSVNDLSKGGALMKDLYFPMHTRASPYIVGILTGYILYQLRMKKITSINKIVCLIGWLVAAVLMLYAIFEGHYVFSASHEYNKLESSFYNGFFRFFWSVGLAWLIVACVMGYGGPVNSILSWPIFGPLGRLTYCIYLTHMAVILNEAGSQRVNTYYSDYTQVKGFFGVLIISIAFATILSLLLEAPIMGLEKLILGKKLRPNRDQATDATPSLDVEKNN